MFKKFAISLLFTLLMATSSATLAANIQASENTHVASVAIDAPIKEEHTAALSNDSADAGNMSSSASIWVLTLALVGFVALSNRRAI